MKEPIARRDFYIAAGLVTAQTLFGFWRYSPRSTALFAVAILASVAIAVGFWQKKKWARGAAMIIAVLSLFNDLTAFANSSAEGLLITRVALAVAVLYWLNRAGVKVHFPEGTT